MTETCATCRYWRMAGTGWGRCHRNPPVRSSSLDSGWPQANADHWCGEHRPVAPAEGDEYTRAAVAVAEADARYRAAAMASPDDLVPGALEDDLETAGLAFLRLYRERHDAQR